jgi:cell wall-associated NlpC family hydrolase
MTRPAGIRFRTNFFVVAIAYIVTACASTGQKSEKQDNPAARAQVSAQTFNRESSVPVPPLAVIATAPAPKASNEDATPVSNVRGAISEVLVYALSLVGVQYRFGGNSAATGFDCSGFVRHVFSEVAAHTLPRRAEEMSRIGTSVTRDGLSPGDLVFYNTLQRPFSHVGIYLGEGRFVHSPSVGRSVEIVNMQDNYWTRRYNGARRVNLVHNH